MPRFLVKQAKNWDTNWVPLSDTISCRIPCLEKISLIKTFPAPLVYIVFRHGRNSAHLVNLSTITITTSNLLDIGKYVINPHLLTTRELLVPSEEGLNLQVWILTACFLNRVGRIWSGSSTRSWDPFSWILAYSRDMVPAIPWWPARMWSWHCLITLILSSLLGTQREPL